MLENHKQSELLLKPEIIGKQVTGTRLYQKHGPESEASYWYDVIFDVFGPCVSPGGISMYAPVSRAAIHQRIKQGKMLAFYFYLDSERRNWFGTKTARKNVAYGLIPVEEGKIWKKELEERALALNKVTREELEGEEPDWYGKFLEWDSEFVKKANKQR